MCAMVTLVPVTTLTPPGLTDWSVTVNTTRSATSVSFVMPSEDTFRRNGSLPERTDILSVSRVSVMGVVVGVSTMRRWMSWDSVLISMVTTVEVESARTVRYLTGLYCKKFRIFCDFFS